MITGIIVGDGLLHEREAVEVVDRGLLVGGEGRGRNVRGEHGPGEGDDGDDGMAGNLRTIFPDGVQM